MDYCFGKGADCSDKTSDEYLFVNNMGYYKNMTAKISISRIKGRSDFQLIYIEHGCGNFLMDNTVLSLSDGSLILYRPGEKQVYSFDLKPQDSYYWIHFTGKGADDLLSRLKLEGSVFHSSGLPFFKEAVEKMVALCRLPDFSTEYSLAGYLMSILAAAAKRLYISDDALSNVIDLMHNQNLNEMSNSDYARLCGLSEYHFIRKFRERTGMSPHKYKTCLLMEKAKDLLIKTNLNISGVAALLGFEDSLYFSRAFKKYTGSSPRKYILRQTTR